MPSFVGVSGFSASCALRRERGGAEGHGSDGVGRWRMKDGYLLLLRLLFLWVLLALLAVFITVYAIRFVLLDAYCVDGSGDGDRVGEGAEPVEDPPGEMMELLLGFIVNTNEAHKHNST